MNVTLLRNKYARSWPERKPLRDQDRAYPVSLELVLTRPFKTDAHFAAYESDRWRLNRGAIDANGSVPVTAIVFDVDCKETHGTDEPAPEQWRQQLRQRVEALFIEHPGGFFYETRGGGRIVYIIDPPFIIDSHDAALEWSQRYLIAIAYLARRFGIIADPACCDWQRCFRAPRATRTSGGPPENWPTIGDPAEVRSLQIRATSDDLLAAASASRLFQRSKDVELGTPAQVDRGLFYWLLRNRGDLGAEATRGGWIVRCPNRAAHTIPSDGTDSTIVYPASGGTLGFIYCYHAHCQGLRPQDWLNFFSPYEIENASEAAGITRRRAS